MTSPARVALTQNQLIQHIHFSFASEDVNEGRPVSPPIQSTGLSSPGHQPHFLYF